MPKIKSAVAAATKRPKIKTKPAAKKALTKKKSKAVLVDVIEDELIGNLENKSESAMPNPAEEIIKEKKYSSAAAFLNNENESQSASDDLDKQKIFFSELASSAKAKKSDLGQKNEAGRRSVSLYRRLVIKFIILVAILIGAVAYFSFSKLTVALTLRGEAINDTLLFRVSDPNSKLATTTKTLADQSDPRENIVGQVKEIKTEISKTYPASGEDFLNEELVGQVKIINNYNKNQALVAKTRILSPDNKLFRLKNAVMVPAGGEVTVDIYADKASEDLAISPTTFTIPGLWLGLQDKIYAKSETAFTFSKKSSKYVRAEDIEQASKDISESLIKKAKAEAGASWGTDNWLYNTDEPATISINAKVGEAIEKFEVKAVGKIIAVSFSKDQTAKLVTAKLNLIIPDDKELVEFNPANISYSLENYDSTSKTVTVKASFSGAMVLKKDATVINPEEIVNLNEDQINSYLKSQVEIKDFQLYFSPAFIRKAPSLVDRIKIEVNKN